MFKMSASLKEKIRNATIGQKTQFSSETVEYNGVKVEIRQPTIEERALLNQRCITEYDNGPDRDPTVKFDHFEFFMWSIIQNTYVPGTDERVFEDTDYAVLKKLPTGSFMDVFQEPAARLMNVNVDVKKKD